MVCKQSSGSIWAGSSSECTLCNATSSGCTMRRAGSKRRPLKSTRMRRCSHTRFGNAEEKWSRCALLLNMEARGRTSSLLRSCVITTPSLLVDPSPQCRRERDILRRELDTVDAEVRVHGQLLQLRFLGSPRKAFPVIHPCLTPCSCGAGQARERILGCASDDQCSGAQGVGAALT